MIYIDPTKVVADFPAVKYVEARPTTDYDNQGVGPVVKVHHGDVFASNFGRFGHKEFTFGSVVGFSIDQAECPFAGVERAKKNNHELFWVNGNGSMLTSGKTEKKTVPFIALGDRVKFEGKYFILERAGNNNVHLRETK